MRSLEPQNDNEKPEHETAHVGRSSRSRYGGDSGRHRIVAETASAHPPEKDAKDSATAEAIDD